MLQIRIQEQGDWKCEDTQEEREHQLERVIDDVNYIMDKIFENDIEIEILTREEDYVYFNCEKDITEFLQDIENDVEEVYISIEEYDNN